MLLCKMTMSFSTGQKKLPIANTKLPECQQTCTAAMGPNSLYCQISIGIWYHQLVYFYAAGFDLDIETYLVPDNF